MPSKESADPAADFLSAEMKQVFRLKYGLPPEGWGPRLRLRFRYLTPDEYYEETVSRLVEPGCKWLDVGCGRDLFPGNPGLARLLADRCELLVGVDPDGTSEANPFVHRRERAQIEHFRSETTFDLITMRMVAEHVTQPDAVVESLARLVRPGGKVVVYTVNRWSPQPIVASLLPFRMHHPLKRIFYQTEKEDTFPTAYRMCTRRSLARAFRAHGFEEASFHHLDDCRTFARFRRLHCLELCVRSWFRALRLRYPENCLLGVYARTNQRREENALVGARCEPGLA